MGIEYNCKTSSLLSSMDLQELFHISYWIRILSKGNLHLDKTVTALARMVNGIPLADVYIRALESETSVNLHDVTCESSHPPPSCCKLDLPFSITTPFAEVLFKRLWRGELISLVLFDQACGWREGEKSNNILTNLNFCFPEHTIA